MCWTRAPAGRSSGAVLAAVALPSATETRCVVHGAAGGGPAGRGEDRAITAGDADPFGDARRFHAAAIPRGEIWEIDGKTLKNRRFSG